MRLQSFLSGQWQDGAGEGLALYNPVNGAELARASGEGLDLASALAFGRERGGTALRAMSYGERAAMLKAVAGVLTDNRERYQQIALENSGNTAGDAALDVDGGIGTLKYYASLGKKLGDGHYLLEGEPEQLTRDPQFQALHLLTPLTGIAVHINAFNFPSWGLWEKAAVALLAGVPVLAKPATATALLSHEMVKDVLGAKVLPEGALSLLCGGGRELMDLLTAQDAVAFTGSADTARLLHGNANVLDHNVRFNVEADSLNSAILGPDVTHDSPEFALFIREVVREITVKAGQKCTAIRRVLVPAGQLDAVAEALTAKLAATLTGDPREEGVRMGPLVSRAQQETARQGIDSLLAETRALSDNSGFEPVGEGTEQGYFIPPTLLCCDQPRECQRVHQLEVFGPVSTLMPYQDGADAFALATRGGGSLVASVFSADDDFAQQAALSLGSAHGRVLMVDESIGRSHSGHGVVMPQCVHGGPGRAGGGEELGGLRGLQFYHQRSAVQASEGRIARLLAQGTQLS